MKISKKSSNNFGLESANRLSMSNMQSRSLNGLEYKVQWKIKYFLVQSLNLQNLYQKLNNGINVLQKEGDELSK